MVKKNVENAINDQIQAEMESAYVYLALAAYCEHEGFLGAAHWMKLQAQEEVGHAMKFYTYLNDVEGRVILQAIEAPKKDYNSMLGVFEAALEHEKMITSRIHKLYELSTNEKDYAFQVSLQWFINEQVEEEANAMEIITKLKSVGDSKEGLFMIDKELGQRVLATAA